MAGVGGRAAFSRLPDHSTCNNFQLNNVHSGLSDNTYKNVANNFPDGTFSSLKKPCAATIPGSRPAPLPVPMLPIRAGSFTCGCRFLNTKDCLWDFLQTSRSGSGSASA